jgi:hypothetical protein
MPTDTDIPRLYQQLREITESLRSVRLKPHEIDSACWLFRYWLEKPLPEPLPIHEPRDECRCWLCRYVWRF